MGVGAGSRTYIVHCFQGFMTVGNRGCFPLTYHAGGNLGGQTMGPVLVVLRISAPGICRKLPALKWKAWVSGICGLWRMSVFNKLKRATPQITRSSPLCVGFCHDDLPSFPLSSSTPPQPWHPPCPPIIVSSRFQNPVCTLQAVVVGCFKQQLKFIAVGFPWRYFRSFSTLL